MFGTGVYAGVDNCIDCRSISSRFLSNTLELIDGFSTLLGGIFNYKFGYYESCDKFGKN